MHEAINILFYFQLALTSMGNNKLR